MTFVTEPIAANWQILTESFLNAVQIPLYIGNRVLFSPDKKNDDINNELSASIF